MAQAIKIERYANSEQMRQAVGRLVNDGWVVQRITSGLDGRREVELLQVASDTRIQSRDVGQSQTQERDGG